MNDRLSVPIEYTRMQCNKCIADTEVCWWRARTRVVFSRQRPMRMCYNCLDDWFDAADAGENPEPIQVEYDNEKEAYSPNRTRQPGTRKGNAGFKIK